jgi:hypothetical protein
MPGNCLSPLGRVETAAIPFSIATRYFNPEVGSFETILSAAVSTRPYGRVLAGRRSDIPRPARHNWMFLDNRISKFETISNDQNKNDRNTTWNYLKRSTARKEQVCEIAPGGFGYSIIRLSARFNQSTISPINQSSHHS